MPRPYSLRGTIVAAVSDDRGPAYNRRHMSTESALAAVLEADERVVAAYLFGSEARGTARATSDVDIAVLFADDPPRTLQGLPVDLQERLQQASLRTVDLLVLNTAPPDIVHRVLRDGRLLVDRMPAARIRFEVRARNEYFDLVPILEEYRRPRQ
jgi:uncharacterized protein